MSCAVELTPDADVPGATCLAIVAPLSTCLAPALARLRLLFHPQAAELAGVDLAATA